MAEDIAALIRQLEIREADVMGYSLDGGVALRTAIQHPEVVTKLVLVSTPFKRDGRLAILPPLTHYNIFSSPQLSAVLAAFLDAPMLGAG